MNDDIFFGDQKVDLPPHDDNGFCDGNEVEEIDGVKYYNNLVQGSDEWLYLRKGMLTASNIDKIMTPTLKVASNDKERQYLYQLVADQVTDFLEPNFQGFDMIRGHEEEIDACALYSEKYAPVRECGFIINESLGFPIGYSPDGRVGDNAGVECKSRKPKYQVQTVIDHVVTGSETIPKEYVLQIQGGLFVTKWEWIDFISYSGGLPMVVIRCHPMPDVQKAIAETAAAFNERVTKSKEKYLDAVKDFPTTEYTANEDISV